MKTFSVHEAKTHLSRLIREVQAGREVIIRKGAVPIIKLVLIANKGPRRQIGLAKGQVEIAEDFDAPLEDFGEYQ